MDIEFFAEWNNWALPLRVELNITGYLEMHIGPFILTIFW